MSNISKKNKWYFSEEIVKNYYINNWFKFIEQNFTVKWWELDLIFSKVWSLKFIEVKNIDWINDLFDYITKKKLNFLIKTINIYLYKFDITNIDYSLDVVFVKKNEIYEIYDNIWI